MTIIDFALEGSSKSALAKALTALGNQLGYDLIDENNQPTEGVTIVVWVPPGGNTTGIPEGFYVYPGPFVHVPGVYDQDGNEVTPPVLSSNWYLDVRLSGPAADRDRDNDGVNEITKSKLKTWLQSTGATQQRVSYKDSQRTITYYEKTLAGGDFVRLYPNIQSPNHVFFGDGNRAE